MESFLDEEHKDQLRKVSALIGELQLSPRQLIVLAHVAICDAMLQQGMDPVQRLSDNRTIIKALQETPDRVIEGLELIGDGLAKAQKKGSIHNLDLLDAYMSELSIIEEKLRKERLAATES